MSADLKRTPLYDWHVRQGAKLVEFGGWEMPIQYSGIIDEHHAVRRRAGLFDVSHMGEVRVRGDGALEFVQRLITNDASRLEDGQALYTVMTRPDGGIIDDLLVYRLAADDYLLVVNAATSDKDFAWIREQAADTVEVENESSRWAQLAIQGPAAEGIVARVVGGDTSAVRYYRSVWCEFDGAPALLSRTGYTGEDGFEIYLAGERGADLADALLEAGGPEGLQPAGLGARDTLRLEAGMLLYGNDMDETRTPIEAGLKWLVKLEKPDFIGKQVLSRQIEEGTAERLVGLVMKGRGIPRHGYGIVDGEGRVGEVTSGTFSPTLQEAVGLGYVRSAVAEPGTRLAVDVRGRAVEAEVVKPPFYRR